VPSGPSDAQFSEPVIFHLENFLGFPVAGEIVFEGVTDAELERAKRRIMASVVQANQTAEGVASRLARDIIATGDPAYNERLSYERAEAVKRFMVRTCWMTNQDYRVALLFYAINNILVFRKSPKEPAPRIFHAFFAEVPISC
jgi:hypothetical protein